jgi:hypothetical protein
MTPLLLTSNSELRDLGVWNWTLPAWVVELADGRKLNVCPSAGACASACYALNGTYLFPGSRAAHLDNLRQTMHPAFPTRMGHELRRRRYRATGRPHLPDLDRGHLHPAVTRLLDTGSPLVRIHDSGDFYSEAYLRAWLTIARMTPHALFYAYTKEVGLLERVGRAAPPNFLWVYSMGGRQDSRVDRDRMRHADVFPTAEALTAAGYYDQEAHDALCVLAPSLRIGIVANHIPAFQKRQGALTFSGMQEARHVRTKVDTPT